MKLRRTSRRRRARRALKSVTERARSLRSRHAAVGPGIATGGAIVAVVARRRRRARLEAELGPPNESAPGRHEAPQTPEAAPPTPTATAPNEGAPGHEPAEPEPAPESAAR